MANKKIEKTNVEIKVTPVISEKSYALANALNKYTFMSKRGLSKLELAKDIEKKYKVKVLSVNSVIKPGKMKTNWKNNVKTRSSDYKKVVVTLKKGDKIDEFFNL